MSTIEGRLARAQQSQTVPWTIITVNGSICASISAAIFGILRKQPLMSRQEMLNRAEFPDLRAVCRILSRSQASPMAYSGE
ncbi:hypothetical protein ELI03_35310 [Rhizobium leguminosarum]|uniref:Uncharacterized protein n=1 Tax=Rhizobium leguminosarum TaxID=384 RepID=A0A4Q8XRD6_RHILE|nr:hypothetical protein [Rhizobium leguminosarum]TAX64119.1 hypothetical protein ELI03_35310 [Rhizobium leguminosarum]